MTIYHFQLPNDLIQSETYLEQDVHIRKWHDNEYHLPRHLNNNNENTEGLKALT